MRPSSTRRIRARIEEDVAGRASGRAAFHVELIKPSHYDDDGYVIQWHRTWFPSNSLACLYGLMLDAIDRGVLGDVFTQPATITDVRSFGRIASVLIRTGHLTARDSPTCTK